MPTPLPDISFEEDVFHAAYQRCVALERDASHVQPIEQCPSPIVCARLLGHLLRLAPTNAQGQLQREITNVTDDAELMRLASFYTNHFIRTFKRSGGPTPVPTEHPSRPSFEDAHEYAMTVMREGRLDHGTARAIAMRRDDYRCTLTKLKDFQQPDGVVAVQAAHIIPQSVNRNMGGPSSKRFQSGGVWAILSMFTNDSIVEDLAGHNINRLENIVSMNAQTHYLFDMLYVWLKPVEGSQHKYRVCVAKESLRGHVPNFPEYVTFSTNTDVPLPHPEYLALHALCCEVAWMSGVAEYVMDIEKRMDDTKVLANDGSNVDLLMTALSLVEVR